MEIVYTDGCIVTNLSIDNTNFSDLPIEKKREICKTLIDQMDDANLQEVVMNYVQVVGDYKHLYTCEECGDSVCEWRFNI